MKTDRLIDLLSANVEPADRGQLRRALAVALIFGAAAAIGGMLAVLGLRADLLDTAHLGFMAVKLGFALGAAGLATAALFGLMRPGRVSRGSLVLLSLPFAAIVLCAVFALVTTPSTNWGGMIMGRQWLACLLFIPVFAILPFAALVWLMRKVGAPTDLARAGAVAGLLAGSLAAAAYALNCPDDSLPFVAVWYGGPIAACTFIGAKLGPRLLRW